MVKKKKYVQKQELKKDSSAQVLITLLKQKIDVKQTIKSLVIFTTLAGAAVAGRVALQNVPSVETITPFSILAGFMLGPIYGFMAGAGGFYVSNFMVWGGQGPWTPFQMFGAGLAGLVAGIFGKMHKGFRTYMFSVFAGIALYELVVNIGGALIFFGLLGLPLYILTSLPFSAIHLTSSLAICAGLWGFRKHLPKVGHKIIEKFKIGFNAEDKDSDGELSPSLFEFERFKVAGIKRELVSRFSWKKKVE